MPNNEYRALAHEFRKTHPIRGKSDSRIVQAILESMRAVGWKGSPIDVVEIGSEKYILNGHHRVYAARKAGIAVQYRIAALPDFGYNSNEEVLIAHAESGPDISASDKPQADERPLRLIAEYRKFVDEAIEAMRRFYGASDLLRAWRTGAIPKSGKLPPRDIAFSFHGTGCRFEFEKEKRVVEVEFGAADRQDGFDAWRLWLFADSTVQYADLDLPAIERALAMLEAKGVIHKSDSRTAGHLYYLTAAITVPH